jgi:hypothetical protein
VRDLHAVLVHLEGSEGSVQVELQNGFPDLLRVERARASDRFHQDLASAVAAGRMIDEIRSGKFLPVGLDELPRPRILARDRDQSPSRYTWPGENTMKTYFRPFLKMELAEAPDATIGILYSSATPATASVIGEDYGPMIRSTLSWVMSFL